MATDDSATFQVDGDAIAMNGVIDCTTAGRFFALLDATPGVTTLRLDYVPGSDDDDANFIFGQQVHERGLHTHVPDLRLNPGSASAGERVAAGLIASGGVDLFLAGIERTVGEGACLGVHSWEDEAGVQGGDLPPDDETHDLYLDYFAAIGYALGRDFYFYTLGVAPAERLHYMSRAELEQFDMVTADLPSQSCPLPDEAVLP
ncbi:MAG: alpha/beta hydrolase [Bacteroidota bacterium]